MERCNIAVARPRSNARRFVGLFVFIFLSTAEFIYAKSTTALSTATAVTLTGNQAAVPLSEVSDDQLHRYLVHVPDGKGSDVEVRGVITEVGPNWHTIRYTAENGAVSEHT